MDERYFKLRNLYLPFDVLNIEGTPPVDLELDTRAHLAFVLNMGQRLNEMKPLKATSKGALYTAGVSNHAVSFTGSATVANNATVDIITPVSDEGNQYTFSTLLLSPSAQPIDAFPSVNGIDFPLLPTNTITSITLATSLTFAGITTYRIRNRSGGNNNLSWMMIVVGP